MFFFFCISQKKLSLNTKMIFFDRNFRQIWSFYSSPLPVIDAECVCCENVVLRKFPSFSRNELNEKAS